jgi:hypothetical protein
MKRIHMLVLALSLGLAWVGSAYAGLLFEASLRNADYGGASLVPTMDCPLGCPGGGAPHNPIGLADSMEGVTFTSTEADNRSNALINWNLGTRRIPFKSHGTVSMWFKADREYHVGGEIFGDNYGYDKFCNGQGTFSASAGRIANGDGPQDDRVQISWKAWFNNEWYYPAEPSPVLAYDRWYNIGFAWGGPTDDFEIWVNGVLAAFGDLPPGVSFPWGREETCCPSGINFGLGANHQRGCGYGSVAGATFADIRIWDEYRPQGDTIPDLVLLCPPDGSALSSAPPFAWASSLYNVYMFISIFDYGAYDPLTFWVPVLTAFDMPPYWWNMLRSGTDHYWLVFGYNTATMDWAITGPWSFTK